MTAKRLKKQKSGSESVRFILSNPKASSRLKLADHLFSAEPPRRNRSVLPKSVLANNHPPQPSYIAAMGVAAACLCAGLAMVVLGILYGQWLVTLLGPPVLWYGFVRVWGARKGTGRVQ